MLLRILEDQLVGELTATGKRKRPTRARVRLPDHPLAESDGRVKVARLILWDRYEGIAQPCHWCGRDLTWKTLCADHLDGNVRNDAVENLVPSCSGCNSTRPIGGRVRHRPCDGCRSEFIPKRTTQRFCSAQCYLDSTYGPGRTPADYEARTRRTRDSRQAADC